MAYVRNTLMETPCVTKVEHDTCMEARHVSESCHLTVAVSRYRNLLMSQYFGRIFPAAVWLESGLMGYRATGLSVSS